MEDSLINTRAKSGYTTSLELGGNAKIFIRCSAVESNTINTGMISLILMAKFYFKIGPTDFFSFFHEYY